MLPIVAIVGRPNVGKSMLFNKLTGHMLSIVEDTPGVTRDRIYAQCDWNNRSFNLVDTGGIEPHTDSEMLKFMRAQALLAIESADVVVFICDIQTGLTAADKEVCTMLQKAKKDIILVVNKVDKPGDLPADFYEFYNLGLGDPVAVSALHGHGTGELLDMCIEKLPDWEHEDEEEGRVRVCVLGKPNVGKSSLINTILGEERVIVSDMAGTTRDAIDTDFENEFGKYCFVDTAGMRKKARIDDQIEKFSVLKTVMAVERSAVCLILIDATQGVTEQDTKVAGIAHNAGRACVIVVNKWDLVEKDYKTMDNFKKQVLSDLAYMTYAPVAFISAKTGQRVNKLFEIINLVHANWTMRITTGALNTVLSDAVTRVQPPSDKGKRLKIYYMTQTGISPPHFVVFCNDITLFHFSYQRYIENQIRGVYNLEGTPIKMTIRRRGEKLLD